ncbi:MAG TPA: alpha/beta hydrolase [Lacipirellulaceae bacterium]|nr:alpha/beta hydrolase [Lacipirellulaceae bacterium]
MPEHKIPMEGASLSVEVRGAGMPVVLLHGFPLDRSMWAAQVESLSREFRVIAPDLRGFGKSTLRFADIDSGVSMERYAEDLIVTLDALSILEPMVLVGFSMGGYVAWQFALRHSQRLRGLVLCDTRAVADTDAAAAARLAMAETVLAASSAEPALAMIEKLLAPETRADRPQVAATVRDMILRQPSAGIAAAQRGMARRPDVRQQLQTIRCPVLGIVGTADVISPPEEMAELVALLPDARLVEVPGGHLTPMENPDAVTAAIRQFAQARVERSGGSAAGEE